LSAGHGRYRLTTVNAEQWAEAYAQAWRDRDAEAAAALFTEECTYRDHPVLGEPHRGQAGVRSYWSNVTATQDQVDVRMGHVIEATDGRAAVEFWVRMLNDGAQITLTGILFLRFAADGRCSELRETWNFEMGDHEPPAGWGL
jgi:uncharacterized protein (TIGR02246 family)